MAKPNRRECRFDGIGRSQVPPVLGREVIEGQQLLAILPQTFARFLILGVVFFQEVIECCLGVRFRFRLPDFVDVTFGFRLNALGHSVQHVGRLVDPTTLLLRFREYLSQSRPEAECSVTHRNLRCRRKPMPLQIQEQFRPTLLAFTIAVEDRDQLFLSVGRRAHQHQNTLLFAGIVFQTDLHMDAVRPDVNVLFLGEVAFHPRVVLVAPLLFEPDDDVGTESLGLLADERLQHLTKVARRDSFEIQPGDQLFDGVGPSEIGGQHARRELHAVFGNRSVIANASLFDLNGPRAGQNFPGRQASVLTTRRRPCSSRRC